MTSPWDKALIALGGLAGCLGVALAAMAAHVTGGGNLETAARFLLLHAPALLAIGALTATRHVQPVVGRVAGFAIALGLALFCGDLAIRALWSIAPFRLAGPIGGVVLMAAWLGVGLAALAPRR